MRGPAESKIPRSANKYEEIWVLSKFESYRAKSARMKRFTIGYNGEERRGEGVKDEFR
jgi:hypothetical protein